MDNQSPKTDGHEKPLFKQADNKTFDSKDKWRAACGFFLGPENIEFIDMDRMHTACFLRELDPNEAVSPQYRKLKQVFDTDTPIGIFRNDTNRGRIDLNKIEGL